MSSKYVTLWHGTSESRADSIAKMGFHANSFFATSVGISWGYASARGKLDDPGVLVLCAIDLNLYKKTEYDIRRGREYHFISAIPRDVVAGIFRIDNFTRGELTDEARLLKMQIRRYRRLRSRQPEIVITCNCSTEAIIYWINTYLSGRTDRRVGAMHPGIKPIRIWVEKNYAHGRISPISEQEMLMQAKRYIPDLFRNVRISPRRP
jgi:hypothetical protein